MKAIILAAGQGTRLKKYTQDLPKGMLSFKGKTIIERQIQTYRNCGIQDIIIVKGFAREKITYSGVKYYINEQYEKTNMIASLMEAKEEFMEDMIVSYSDILFEEQMLATMIKSQGDAVVAVDDNWKKYWSARYGTTDYDTESLVIDNKDNILELGKESPALSDIDARYIGLLKFTKSGLNKMASIWENDCTLYGSKPWKQSQKPIKKSYMTDILQALIESGECVKAEHFSNSWIEFDTNGDYECACKWAENGMLREFITL